MRLCVIILGTVEYCCYGYLIDMLDMLKINMSVTFDLHLVADNNYGGPVAVSILLWEFLIIYMIT